MSKALPERIVRVIVREWLGSKEATLHGILDAMAEQLVPIARDQCRAMLQACIDPDPRDQQIDDAVTVLRGAGVHLQLVHAGINGNAITNISKEHVLQAMQLIDDFMRTLQAQASRDVDLVLAAADGQGGKGGAA